MVNATNLNAGRSLERLAHLRLSIILVCFNTDLPSTWLSRQWRLEKVKMILIRIYFDLYFEIEWEENYRSFFLTIVHNQRFQLQFFLERSVKIKPTFSKMAQINRKLCLERRGRKRKLKMKIIGQFVWGSSDSSLLFFFFKSRCGDKCVKEERLCDGGYMWIERKIVQSRCKKTRFVNFSIVRLWGWLLLGSKTKCLQINGGEE